MFLTSKRQRKCLESTFSVSVRVRVLQTRIWGSAWGNPSPGVHFPRSTFASSLEEPKPRGFELMGVFLPEPGLPVAYPELLIRSWKAGGTQIKLGTGRSGGIHSTAPRLQGGASILGTPATWFSLFFSARLWAIPSEITERQESLVFIPKYKCSWLRSRWTLKYMEFCHWTALPLVGLVVSVSVSHTTHLEYEFLLSFEVFKWATKNQSNL